MVHQDRVLSRSRERERDQTHSYWYIPSAPRVNYSILVMESAGTMKMATGDDFPLRQGAETGSRLVFGGYRGLRRRKSRSIFCSGSFRVRRYIWVKEVRQGPHRESTRTGACPRGVGAPSTLVAASTASCLALQVRWIRFLPNITSPVDFVPFRLRLIFLFFKTLK